MDGQKGNIRTDVKKKTATPEWDEEFTMYVLCVWGGGRSLLFLAVMTITRFPQSALANKPK